MKFQQLKDTQQCLCNIVYEFNTIIIEKSDNCQIY